MIDGIIPSIKLLAVFVLNGVCIMDRDQKNKIKEPSLLEQHIRGVGHRLPRSTKVWNY